MINSKHIHVLHFSATFDPITIEDEVEILVTIEDFEPLPSSHASSRVGKVVVEVCEHELESTSMLKEVMDKYFLTFEKLRT